MHFSPTSWRGLGRRSSSRLARGSLPRPSAPPRLGRNLPSAPRESSCRTPPCGGDRGVLRDLSGEAERWSLPPRGRKRIGGRRLAVGAHNDAQNTSGPATSASALAAGGAPSAPPFEAQQGASRPADRRLDAFGCARPACGSCPQPPSTTIMQPVTTARCRRREAHRTVRGCLPPAAHGPAPWPDDCIDRPRRYPCATSSIWRAAPGSPWLPTVLHSAGDLQCARSRQLRWVHFTSPTGEGSLATTKHTGEKEVAGTVEDSP